MGNVRVAAMDVATEVTTSVDTFKKEVEAKVRV
jgi:hypothetical protein